MNKLNKITSIEFMEEVRAYQNKVYYSDRGQCIQRAAGIELTPQQATYIHAIMVMSGRDLIDLGRGFVDIPVKLLFTLMTPYDVKCYEHLASRSYMGEVTQTCIRNLSSIVMVNNHAQGRCRAFALDKQFVASYYSACWELLTGGTSVPDSQSILRFAMTKSPKGSGFEYVNRLNPYTIATLNKVQDSQFRFNADYFHSAEGKAFIRNQNLTNSQVDSLNCALEFINKYTTEPQYHGSFHLQHAGRMHTVGGCIQMPKWFRDAFILPIDSSNVRVELDLKCAQLLILCDILGQETLKERILTILDKDGSIWPSIGSPDLDKRLKKVIVYAFCYGGELKTLPFLASKEARMKGLHINVKQPQVDECLDGLLAPLVEARETWLYDYTVAKIIKSTGERKPKNALGYPFSLYQTAAALGATLTGKKLHSTKVGSQFLAHLAQGQEQFIVQGLIANDIRQNILTFQYDGLTLEVAKDEVDQLRARLQAASNYPLEFTLPTQPARLAGAHR